jgi:hypothetical protein
MWGSDQAASVEILGAHRLVRNIRDIEQALGDGVKRVYDSEKKSLQKLRRVRNNGRPPAEYAEQGTWLIFQDTPSAVH